MARRSAKSAATRADGLPRFPLPDCVWDRVAQTLSFPPQEKQVVELLMSGLQDKEIAAEMCIGVPTLRTYLARIFNRAGVASRLQLVLRVFSLAREFGLFQDEQTAQ